MQRLKLISKSATIIIKISFLTPSKGKMQIVLVYLSITL